MSARVLVISNAGAARARRWVGALREALPEPAVSHRVTEQAGELQALVAHDRWRPDDLLVINGGDGSVQFALTALLGHCPPGRLPRLACLPGGTTNMTAFDLNRHRTFRDCLVTLRSILTNPATWTPAPRSVVRVRPHAGADEPPPCGLFFGIGTIVQGIEYFHERIRRSGGAHELGAGAALVRTLWGIARGQPPFSEPFDVRLAAPALLPASDSSTTSGSPCHGRPPHDPTGHSADVSVRLLLATTLDRLFLGIRPYWGTGAGVLKTTLVERRARRFISRVPRLLRGRPDLTMTPELGYHSARLNGLSLTFSGSYTLDGELFRNPGNTMDVGATEPVNFLPL